MNCTVEEAEAFFKHFKMQKKEGVEMLICPPFTDLPLTNFFLARTSIHWGAQNVYPEEKRRFYRRNFSGYAERARLQLCHLRSL